MGRSKSSARWLREHNDDFYVKQARSDGKRSRSAYKLLELQEKYGIITAGMSVVDLGASPGGWSQIVSDFLGSRGNQVALDILPMVPLTGVTFIQGDFTESHVLDAVMRKVGKEVDLVLSDMSPNLSGIRVVDQSQSMYLAELAMDFALQVLKKNGCFLSKVFQGEGLDCFVAQLRRFFGRVQFCKPLASRDKSRELYLLGREYVGQSDI